MPINYVQSLQNRQEAHSGTAYPTAYPTASGLPFLRGTGYATGTLGLAPKSSDSVLLDVTFVIGLPLPKAIWPQNLSMARLFILDYFGLSWDLLSLWLITEHHRSFQRPVSFTPPSAWSPDIRPPQRKATIVFSVYLTTAGLCKEACRSCRTGLQIKRSFWSGKWHRSFQVIPCAW